MSTQPSMVPSLLSSYLQTVGHQFSDVILECEGIKFSCHKVILAANSQFFSSLFSENFTDGNDGTPPVYSLPGVTKGGLEQIINFIYCRPMKLNMSTVFSVVKDADFLDLEEVTNECSDFMLSNLNVTNCFSVYESSRQFHLSKLRWQVEEFIFNNFCQMGGVKEFLSLRSL